MPFFSLLSTAPRDNLALKALHGCCWRTCGRKREWKRKSYIIWEINCQCLFPRSWDLPCQALPLGRREAPRERHDIDKGETMDGFLTVQVLPAVTNDFFFHAWVALSFGPAWKGEKSFLLIAVCFSLDVFSLLLPPGEGKGKGLARERKRKKTRENNNIISTSPKKYD